MRQFEYIAQGTRVMASYFWALLRSIPVHFPVSVFYASMTPILVYLKYESTQSFGLNVYENVTGAPWWTLVALFAFCGLITAQERAPIVYGLATLPMLMYATLLGHGTATGSISPVGLTAIVYLSVAVFAVLGTLRYYVELDGIKRELSANQKLLAELRRDVGRNTG